MHKNGELNTMMLSGHNTKKKTELQLKIFTNWSEKTIVWLI